MAIETHRESSEGPSHWKKEQIRRWKAENEHRETAARMGDYLNVAGESTPEDVLRKQKSAMCSRMKPIIPEIRW